MKMKFFESMINSTLYYSLDVMPDYKSEIEIIKNFVGRCYKDILGIPREVQTNIHDLEEMLQVPTVENILKRKRLMSVSHITRLNYDNPARIVVLGKPIMEQKGRKKNIKTWRKTIDDDIQSLFSEPEYVNMCDRRCRRIIKEMTK